MNRAHQSRVSAARSTSAGTGRPASRAEATSCRDAWAARVASAGRFTRMAQRCRSSSRSAAVMGSWSLTGVARLLPSLCCRSWARPSPTRTARRIPWPSSWCVWRSHQRTRAPAGRQHRTTAAVNDTAAAGRRAAPIRHVTRQPPPLRGLWLTSRRRCPLSAGSAATTVERPRSTPVSSLARSCQRARRGARADTAMGATLSPGWPWLLPVPCRSQPASCRRWSA